MKQDLISIVVPIYNVDQYLKKCVDSLLNQTYKNIEIILVDDGSPDTSPAICDEYKKKFKNIRVIHKENGGLSDARNKGIDIAKGKYISFVDSDDYVTEDYIETLYNTLKESKADMSMCKQYIVYESKTINSGSGLRADFTPKKCFKKLLYSDDVDVSAWAKLYKMELFKDVRYPKGRLFEDAATTYKLIDKSKVIAFNSVPIYYYIIRKNSITNNKFNPKKMDLITSTKEMTDYIRKKYKDLSDACDRRLMYAYLSTYTQLIKDSDKHEEEEILYNYIKNNKGKVLKDKNIPKRDRIALYSFSLGKNMFKICWNLYSKITGRA